MTRLRQATAVATIAIATTLAATTFAAAQAVAPLTGNPNAENTLAPGNEIVRGKVTQWDLAGRSVALDNGKSYMLAPDLDLPTLGMGQNVALTLDADGKSVVKIAPVD